MTTALVACSSSSPTTGTPTGTQTATGDGGSGGSGGSATGGGGGTGGSATGGGGAGGGDSACEDLSGVYTKSAGSCSNALYRYPSVICVRQSECTATVYGSDALQLEGGISGATGTFTTETPVHQSCVAEKQTDGSATVSCEAESVGVTCDGTSQPATVDDSSETCCNVKMQDCADPARRCQPVFLGKDQYTTACIPVTGDKQVGEACERTPSDASGVGRDDCAKGLFCANWGVIGGGRVCRKLCDSESACGAGEHCMDLEAAPRAGGCVATCDPFASPSTCPNGAACHDVKAAMDSVSNVPMTLCSAVGSAAEGESCTATTDCAEGMRCAGTCRVLCDKDHPCADGKTCEPLFSRALPPLDVSFGMCE